MLSLHLKGQLLPLDRPLIMGILNVTPDSFYDGGRHQQGSALFAHAQRLIQEGADIIDVGGYSTRPGASEVSLEEELRRVKAGIEAVQQADRQMLISVDTFRATVAEQAVGWGAHLINDISAGQLDAQMFETAARLRVPYILMHSRGNPQTMQGLTQYEHLVEEIIDFLREKIALLTQTGVADIIVDPGFGFAKTVAQNFELLEHLSLFHTLGKPLLVGVSRKSMVWKTLGISPEEALHGTTVLNTIALQQGAHILRVHDPKPAKEAAILLRKLHSHESRKK